MWLFIKQNEKNLQLVSQMRKWDACYQLLQLDTPETAYS